MLNASINSTILLQETNYTQKDENMGRAEWGDQVFFSNRWGEVRRTCMLLTNNIDFEVTDTIQDMKVDSP